MDQRHAAGAKDAHMCDAVLLPEIEVAVKLGNSS
jgi:hypothetical protein